MIIGITGSIATGKSTLTNYLIKKGYRVIDSDKIVHQQYETPEIIEKIVHHFGQAILKDGEIDRKLLGNIIFNDEKKRLLLNSILHPKVIFEIRNLPKTDELIFVDVPLLFEVKLEYLFDKIIVVYTSIQTQIKRLMNRDKITAEYAIQKISAQIDIEVKKAKADFVINNENSIQETYKQTEELLRRLKNEI